MLNSLRDSQINYGTTNCPSAHVPPHNVVTPLHPNSLMPTEPTTPVVYPWNSNPRLEHLYGFHSRYYNIDFPTPYSPTANQYVPTNMYGQNVPQCCQPCCRLRSQNIPKTSPPQMLYNTIRPVQQVNRSYKSKKTLKTPCSDQFLPYIPNDLPAQYDTQNSYQQKYSNSYLSSTNYCPPPNNNLWIPPEANPTWSSDRLRPIGRHTGMVTNDFSRDKNYQRLPNYQSNLYSSSTAGATHHRPYNYNPPIPEVHDYRPSVYHNQLKTNTSEYLPPEHNSRLPNSSQNNQSLSSMPQYYNTQPVLYSDISRPSEPFKTQITPQNTSKSNLNVREFLANWDEGEEEMNEKSSETTAPIVVLDCMTLEGEALTKIQEKLNVVSYENLEKVLKENQNPLIINSESNEIDSVHTKTKLPVKSNFEPLDYTKRETGIIKPFNTEKKNLPEINCQSDKSYSVNFDGMVTWYGKKNTDISSTDLIEKLADKIFNLSKSQENEGVSFGTAAYTGQITQTNRSIESLIKDPSKYVHSPHMFSLHHAEKCTEPSIINKVDCKNDSISKAHCCIMNESSNKASTIKANNINSSCIVENISKKCLNLSNTNEETTPWNLDQGSQEQHLNMSLYDHSVIIKPLDFSSLTDDNKGNPFVFEKSNSSSVKPNGSISDQFNKVLNENNNYNSAVSNSQHSIQQIDSSNRNFPVIVSPHIHRQEYNGYHESVIQRTGCDKNKPEKLSTNPDFETLNWNLSNDLDKIMKNTNITTIEPPCLYDRNNYGILDNINSNKTISTTWKDNMPCVDLTVNNKTIPNHDSFFDGWNFIDSYENHSSKKVINTSSVNNEVHNPLFSNQITSLEELNNRNNSINKKNGNESMVSVKEVSYSKPNDLSSSSTRSRDVFNLNSRIPDFSDGFELTAPTELHDYMQFKKSSIDNDHRTDGSIFEHLTEPKCVRTVNEMTNAKNDHIKSDIVGLPTFKEKDPLAPMPVPSKLNIVKPIIRDPNQIFTVIKQKSKHDNSNTCVDNDSVGSNKAGLCLRGNQANSFNGSDMKTKYNNRQLSQFDVWSEKFVLKGNSNNTISSVVQCDVEITQFKSTSENSNILISKPNTNENYLDKNTMIPENLCANKLNNNENDKINSNDFINCLENSKTDNQKYHDPLDEFETSFGFDMHCNNESNKSFHENIVDTCLEERINGKIGKHDMNTSDSTNALNSNTTSSNNTNTHLPFQCDFQSSYLIKNYFDENKNKPITLDQERVNNSEKSSTTGFSFHGEIEQGFEFQNSKNIHTAKNSGKKADIDIVNDINCDFKEQIKNNNQDEHSCCINQTNLKLPFESNHENMDMSKMSPVDKNNLNYLTIDDRSFELKNKNNIEIHKHNENTDGCNINSGSKSNFQNSCTIKKHPTTTNDGFDLNITNTNIYENNVCSKSTNSTDIEIENTKNNFESTFHPENSEDIDQQIQSKNKLEIKNNDSDLHQTHNIEQIPDFDFETRIIQNFEMECSSNNIEEPRSTNDIFTSKNQSTIECSYKINDEANKEHKELKNTLGNLEKPFIEEVLELDHNAQPSHVNESSIDVNKGNKIDNIFEVDCLTSNIGKPSNNDSELNVQNKDTKNTDVDSSYTRADCNAEVENIFEGLYDNLRILNCEKDNPGSLDHRFKNDDKDDLSSGLENIKNTHLKVNNLEIIEKSCDETQVVKSYNESDKTFEDSNGNLLKDLVNSSTSPSLTISLHQNKLLVDQKIHKKIVSVKYNAHILDTHLLNNEHFLNISNKTAVCENLNTFEEKQSKTESINNSNMQNIKNTTAETLKCSTSKKIFEDINVFNDVLIKHETQVTKQEISSLNPVELTVQENVNTIVNTEDSTCLLSNSVKLRNKQYSNTIFDVENIASSGQEFSNHKYSHKCVDVENIHSSVNSSTHFSKLTYQQHSNKIVDIIESITDFSQNSTNLGILTCHEESNKNVHVDDTTSFKHTSLNNVKSKRKQDYCTILEVKNTTRSGSSLLNIDESVCENSNKLISVDGPSNTVLCSLNRVNIKNQQNLNNNEDIEAENNFRSCLLNVDQISRHHEVTNKVINVEDTTDFGPSLFKNVEPLNQKYSNEVVEVDDLSNSRSATFNINNLSYYHNSNDSNNVENNFDNAKLIKQQHFNKSENTTNFKPSTVNHVELLNHQLLNKVVDAKNLTNLKLNSSDNLELNNELHFKKIDKIEDIATSSLNVDELINQEPNKIIGVDVTVNVTPNSLNKIELFNKQQSTKDRLQIVGREDEGRKKEQQSAKMFEIKGVTSPESCSLINDNLISHQDSNKSIVVEDRSHYRSNTLNNIELFNQHQSNETTEVTEKYTANSVCSPLNVNNLSYQKSDDINVDKETDLRLGLLKSPGLFQGQNSNKITEAKNTIFGSSHLNFDKSTVHLACNEIKDIDDSTNVVSSSLNNVKLTHCNNFVEFNGASDSIKTVESTCKQHSNKIETEDTTNCSLINVELKSNQPSKEPINDLIIFKNSTFIESSCSKVETNFNYENTDSIIADNVKLPRVKFFLKCHNKSMIKKNVFDEKPTMHCKKSRVVKDVKLVAGNIYKNRNNFFKPWQKVLKKQSLDESKDNIKEMVKTDCPQIDPTIFSGSDNVKQNDNIDAFSAKLPYSDQEPQNQYYENPKSLENQDITNSNLFNSSSFDKKDDDLCLSPSGKECITPVPSPFDDFQSDSPTSEYFGCEEYWDKSLENEYNNVLYKTISKLTSKPRVNIRDKFNTRLLAQRVNKTKQKLRYRQWGKFDKEQLRVGDNELKTRDITAVVGMPTTVLRWNVTTETNPRCKIKVQLPWGRIFNLKNPRSKDQLDKEVHEGTKLELGPAKVKVRLSRAPGEWQVAACCQSNHPKSTVVSVRRLVLQRAISPTSAINNNHDQMGNITSRNYDNGNSPQQEENFRKLPKIVIRRNEQDNNYTSYVSTSNGVEFEEGDDNKIDDDEDTPRLIVRLVRDRKLDAMAADGITKLSLTHHVPNPENVAAAMAEDDDTHNAKRIRYT